MKKRVRIIDIAKKAGVSKGTVDRVIHKRGNVAPAVKKRILAVMEELEYRPNAIASALAYNRTWKVAALLPDPADDVFWIQPKKGIQKALNFTADYGMTVDFFHFVDADTERFQAHCSEILAGQYDAVLVAPVFYNQAHEFLNQCATIGLKYFLINTFLERADASFQTYVGQDSYQSGVLAAKLLDFGIEHKDAVMVLHLEKGVYNAKHLLAKEQGFQNYFIDHSTRNIQIIKTNFEEPTDTIAFRKFMNYQLKSYPNLRGIFVTTSKIYHLVNTLSELQAQRIKLVGFDLIEPNLEHLRAEKIDFLINQNPVKQGYLGIINIFEHLVRKEEVQPLQHLPLDVVMQENLSYYLEADKQLHLMI
ncbi:MAG: LacI family DNA-binding transcriptional regulator [Bacteroidota bacterium]